MTTTGSAALSPIDTGTASMLNVDVLWSIFWENTEMFNDNLRRPNFYYRNHEERKYEEENSPLTTLRRTSQVCHLWREVILGSSALWGRVIDLNVLMWKRRAFWRREVLERAGEAPVYIAGTLRVQSKSSGVFFKRLLDERWSSIRKLSVAIPDPTGSEDSERDQFTLDETWGPLQRPSPHLEVFKLFRAECDKKCQVSDLPLFSHTAPALYDFALKAKLPAFSLQAPWLKQLRELELGDLSDLKPTDFITALSDMPFLKGLYIYLLRFKAKYDERPQFKLTLDSLKRLELFDSFKSCLFVLKNITIPSRCVLFLDVFDYFEPGTLPKAYVEDICHELSEYIKNHFVDRKESLQSIFLSLYWNMLEFDITPRIKSRTEQSHMFTFDFQLPSTLVYEVFKVLFNPQLFAHIDTFTVGAYEGFGSMKAHVLKQLAVFWSSLPSVTTLAIWCLKLDVLLSIQEKYPDIFPNLQTLYYRNLANPTAIQQFLAFILKRIDAGRPLAILNLPHISPAMSIAELNHLDVVQGLKVIWGSEMSNNKYEYICGSGTEEKQGKAEVALLLPFFDSEYVDV